jgi:predicted RNase H-like HicB family nuclease
VPRVLSGSFLAVALQSCFLRFVVRKRLRRPFVLANSGRKLVKLTAVYQHVPEGYIAFVEELPGANIQGDTLEEARENLREAVALVLEANREVAEAFPRGADG